MVFSNMHLFGYEEKGYHSSLLFESWDAFLSHKNPWYGCSGQTPSAKRRCDAFELRLKTAEEAFSANPDVSNCLPK